MLIQVKSIRTKLAAAILFSVASTSQALVVTREFSASWYDPAHPGHGFNVEVVGSDSNKTMVLYWYTYDAQGNASWVFGTGPVQNNGATISALTAKGGNSSGTFNPANVQLIDWGTINVRFSDCNNGSVNFVPRAGSLSSGTLAISRLTQLHNTDCSAGISGDTRPNTSGAEIIQSLQNAGVINGASGKMKFEERADRSEFSVEIEDVPAATYSIFVDGSKRADLIAKNTANGIQGEVEFRSPVEAGKILLDFDPRGKLVEVKRDTTVIFSSTLGVAGGGNPPPPGGNPPPPGGNPPPAGTGAPPFGNAEYALELEPQGNDGPSLDAKLEQRSNRVDFSVELEDLPVGNYGLKVDGASRGSISVVSVAGGTEGEIEFRNPVEPGKTLLDFDPRGKVLEILSGSNLVLSGVFPNTPN